MLGEHVSGIARVPFNSAIRLTCASSIMQLKTKAAHRKIVLVDFGGITSPIHNFAENFKYILLTWRNSSSSKLEFNLKSSILVRLMINS